MGHLRPTAWQLEEMDEVSSTQDVACRLADDGAPEGTVVTAKIQTAGRGRAGRAWHSPLGGLYVSVVLRPPVRPNPQLLSLVGALSVVKGIKSSTGIDSTIRWPNDVLIQGRKVSGVIVDANYSGQTLSFAVLGIGLNCNSKASFAGPGAKSATSLTEELRRSVDIPRVREGILESLQKVYTSWLEGADIIREAESFMGTLGRRVLVKSKSGEEFDCTAVGLDISGGLLVESDGRKTLLRAEDVELLSERGRLDPKHSTRPIRYGGADG
jgi:BirA family transcriptional regulator, biotin operon repressor / biotin---[acetyl-CoA-carboxylase] ligase